MPSAIINLEQYSDPSAWDHIDYNVPVFTEHELWEVPHPWKKGKTCHLAILPGDAKPKVGTMLYAIGEKELSATADKINDALNSTANTVGVFIGHRNQALPEQEQPKLVGHGVGATMGTFGPKNIKAVILDRICYAKGAYEEAKTYPHRSPEFKPLTGQLTGLALLRNDPKLPLGMMYKHADTFCYGPDFLKDKKSDKEPKGDKPEGGDVPTSIKPKGTDADPSKPPTVSEPDQVEYEAWKTHMDHYKRNDPMMLQMCKNYESECASAMAPPVEDDMADESKKPEEGKKPEGEKKPPKVDMAAEDAAINYQALVQRLDAQDKTNKDLATKLETLSTANLALSTKYAQSEANRIEARLSSLKVIKDRKKLRDKLAATDDAGRKAIFDDVIENYADLDIPDRDPSKAPTIEVYNEGGVEGEQADPVISEMDMTAAVQYAEANKLDFDKDYAKICAAMKR